LCKRNRRKKSRIFVGNNNFLEQLHKKSTTNCLPELYLFVEPPPLKAYFYSFNEFFTSRAQYPQQQQFKRFCLSSLDG